MKMDGPGRRSGSRNWDVAAFQGRFVLVLGSVYIYITFSHIYNGTCIHISSYCIVMYIYVCILCILIHLNPTRILQGKGLTQIPVFCTYINTHMYLYIYIHIPISLYIYTYVSIYIQKQIFICEYMYIISSTRNPNLSDFQSVASFVPSRSLVPAMTACFYAGRSSYNPSTIPTVRILNESGPWVFTPNFAKKNEMGRKVLDISEKNQRKLDDTCHGRFIWINCFFYWV